MPATDFSSSAAMPARLAGWLRLSEAPGLGRMSARRLLKVWSDPNVLLEAPASALIAHLRELGHAPNAPLCEALESLQAPNPEAERQLEACQRWLAQPGRQLIGYTDAAYPEWLRESADPPLLLYTVGRTELLAETAVAIVGARRATAQGKLDARRFAQSLSEVGVCIVSGLAHGIDAAAHEGGLEGIGSTVAVLGTGIDRCYPAANVKLARRIAEQGCLVSEYPLGTPPLADNFPRRNRIICGLARAVLVVEAAAQSGSLITARLALDDNRDVLAIPGSIHAPLSRGCHVLLREGAGLAETPADVLAALGNLGPRFPDPEQEAEDDAVLAALGHTAASADALLVRLGWPLSTLQACLTQLELARRVERLPGGMFRVIQ